MEELLLLIHIDCSAPKTVPLFFCCYCCHRLLFPFFCPKREFKTPWRLLLCPCCCFFPAGRHISFHLSALEKPMRAVFHFRPVMLDSCANHRKHIRQMWDDFHVLFFFGRQSGLSGLSEVETSRGGSVRIQHRPPRHPSGGGNSVVGASSVVTLGVPSSSAGVVSTNVTHTSRFPKLDECAHFHYDVVDLGPLAVTF